MINSLTIKNTLETPVFSRPPVAPAVVILIVDDDEDSRLMLKTLLELWKYRVIEAADGLEAVKIAAQARPDLVLMDVRLPNLDGFDAACRIRLAEKTKNVPIIFLSGCAETIYKRKAKAAGGNGYLTKPLDFEKLARALGKYIPASELVSI